MPRITALGSVAASSADYGTRFGSVPAVPQQLLASYYAQGTDGEIQRAEDFALSKILSARWHIPPDV
jgi:hypothetical protein